MSTLYRKYRPQNFEEVVGQNHIKLTIRHEIETGKIAHAYIFCGPRAVGKTTMARVFAKAINCQESRQGKSEPCNKCESCNEITNGRHIDIIEIDAASNTGVDNVRENIIANARVTPAKAKFKVFIIDEVHMLSLSSFNALLKIIEEPPVNVIFILCTTEIHKVPNTIISRCQRFDFRKISISDIAKKLSYIAKAEKIIIEKNIIESIARQSQGYMRDAESLFGQVIAIAGKVGKDGSREVSTEEADLIIPRSDLNEALNLLDHLLKKDAASAIALVNQLIFDGIDLKVFLNDFIELSRKIILNKISPSLNDKFGLDMGDSLERKTMEIAHNSSPERMVLIVEKFIKATNELKGSAIMQLPVELAIIELCQVVIETKNSVQTTNFIKEVAVEKKNASTNTVKTNSTSLQFSQEEIKNKWSEFLVKIKKYNHSLSFILKVCQPREFIDNQLELAFKYKFHKERVSDPQIKVLIEKTLFEVFGLPLSFVALIDETLEVGDNGNGISEAKIENSESQDKKSAGDENLMDNLLKTFGGRVIN